MARKDYAIPGTFLLTIATKGCVHSQRLRPFEKYKVKTKN